MKKNYFESDIAIIPFEQVFSIVNQNEKEYLVTSAITRFGFTDLDQLAEYKEWLALKQQALENEVQQKLNCSETPKDSKPEISEDQINEILRASCCHNCYYVDYTNATQKPCNYCEDFSCFRAKSSYVEHLNRKWQVNDGTK